MPWPRLTKSDLPRAVDAGTWIERLDREFAPDLHVTGVYAEVAHQFDRAQARRAERAEQQIAKLLVAYGAQVVAYALTTPYPGSFSLELQFTDPTSAAAANTFHI